MVTSRCEPIDNYQLNRFSVTALNPQELPFRRNEIKRKPIQITKDYKDTLSYITGSGSVAAWQRQPQTSSVASER